MESLLQSNLAANGAVAAYSTWRATRNYVRSAQHLLPLRRGPTFESFAGSLLEGMMRLSRAIEMLPILDCRNPADLPMESTNFAGTPVFKREELGKHHQFYTVCGCPKQTAAPVLHIGLCSRTATTVVGRRRCAWTVGKGKHDAVFAMAASVQTATR